VRAFARIGIVIYYLRLALLSFLRLLGDRRLDCRFENRNSLNEGLCANLALPSPAALVDEPRAYGIVRIVEINGGGAKTANQLAVREMP
jgi:hypothetical protein